MTATTTRNIRNHRTIEPDGTVKWLMERQLAGCTHSYGVGYNPENVPPNEAARLIRQARRLLQIAIEQQRDAIRLQNHYYD